MLIDGGLKGVQGADMLFLTEYKLRGGMDRSDTKRLMDIFGSRGASPGEKAHYVKADGSGGVTLNEVEDVAVIYAETLAYTEFMEFTFTPVLAINDAVGPILAELAKG